MAIKLLTRSISVFTLFLMFYGCSSTGPSRDITIGHDPLLDQNGGVVAIVDICIKRDEVGEEGTDDYYIIEESKLAAQALFDATRDYLLDNGVQVREAIIPFVCGALHDEANSKKKVAERANDEIKDLSQPFGVNSEIKDDEEYLNALSIVSTYVAQYESGAQLSEFIVGPDEVKAAADVIADRTQSSSVLYLNVAGTTISSGKAFGQWLGRFTVGVVTAVATAGLGTGYYGYYIPGGEPDVRYVGAAIVDLDSGVITWSNGLRAVGDPIDPEVIADVGTLDLLLFDLVHESTTAMSLKNENIQLLNGYAGSKAQLFSMKPPEEPLELCRGGVRVGSVLTAHRRIQEAFNNVLKSAGTYDSDYGVRLSGSLDKIDFSSSSSDAWWDMEVTLSTEDERAITIQSHYEFESSFGGAAACQKTKEAFYPAVQKLIKDIAGNPEFHDLLTNNVSVLETQGM